MDDSEKLQRDDQGFLELLIGPCAGLPIAEFAKMTKDASDHEYLILSILPTQNVGY